MQKPEYIFTNNSQLSSIKFTILVVSLDSHCPLPGNGIGLTMHHLLEIYTLFCQRNIFLV